MQYGGTVSTAVAFTGSSLQAKKTTVFAVYYFLLGVLVVWLACLSLAPST